MIGINKKKGTYFTILRTSQYYSGQEELDNLNEVINYIKKTYSDQRYASGYTLVIKEHYGDLPGERKLYKKLKKKYEGKTYDHIK